MNYGDIWMSTSPKQDQRVARAKERSSRTRLRIRDAANRLVLEHGFEATTVDDIAAAAGVSKAAFYLHFARKEDLLLEYASRRLQLIKEMLPDLIGAPRFRDVLDQILNAAVRGKEWHPEVTSSAISEMIIHADRMPVADLATLLVPLVELAQARGEVRSDVPAVALSQFVVRSIIGALRDWGQGVSPVPRDETLEFALTMIFDGISKQ
jgi:AcrR family transcriptional regulator